MSFLKGLKRFADFRPNAEISALNNLAVDTTQGLLGALPTDFANLLSPVAPPSFRGNVLAGTPDANAPGNDVYGNVAPISATNITGIIVVALNPSTNGVMVQAINGGKKGFWGLQGIFPVQFNAQVTLVAGTPQFCTATAASTQATALTQAGIRALGNPIGVLGNILSSCASGVFPNNICFVDFDGDMVKKAIK